MDAMSQSGPKLCWGVLREAALVAPRQTCATLMRTCRFFYHEGAISLLQDRVELTDDQSILRFLNFLEAGDEPRFPYVRNTSFRSPTFGSPQLKSATE